MPFVSVRPELLHGWHGQSQLTVTTRGECGPEQPLSGYFFRETRYLRTLRLRLQGRTPWLAQAAVEDPTSLRFDYVYPELPRFGGGGTDQSGDEPPVDQDGIPARALDIRVRYVAAMSDLHIQLEVTNRWRRTIEFDVAWQLDADFADLQEALQEERRQTAPVERGAGIGVLRFSYQHPALPLATRIAADERWSADDEGLRAHVVLEPQQTMAANLRVEPHDPDARLSDSDIAAREEHWRRWKEGFTGLEARSRTLPQAILAASVRDFASFPLLDGARDEWLAMQAGIPAYAALFGRDTITAGWQAAFLDRGESLDASLTRLGRMQADHFDDEQDAEPGRIPFQLRPGPLARLGITPLALSYADYASPLMFVIALSHLYAWGGERDRLRRHWDTARRILDWAREHGDLDGDGYLEYRTRANAGPKNQGWKDSGGAIVYDDGSPVPAPLGTCELQGYWFAAQQLFAVLSWVMDEREDAKAYWRSATELKERFNRDWWVQEEDCVALAMDPGKELVRACTSNAGHCLATGIISDDHLPRVVERLFRPDMFSGWGIRTLSADHAAYDPLSYHRGSIWGVENATIVFGLRRFGFDDRAVQLSAAMFDLAELYPDYRLPECVGGYARDERLSPGAYPRANPVQLWNASGIALIAHSLLGLQPVAPLSMLVVDPILPPWLPELVLRRLRLGDATATLRFWRDTDGDSHVHVVEQTGKFRLVKQPPPESLTSGVVDRLGALIDGLWHRSGA